MTDNSLQRFIISYKKEPIYYLTDKDLAQNPTSFILNNIPTSLPYGVGIVQDNDKCITIYKKECSNYTFSGDLYYTNYICISGSNNCSSDINPGQTYSYSCTGRPLCNDLDIPPQNMLDIILYFKNKDSNITDIPSLINKLSTKWNTIPGEHLTPLNITRQYLDISFEITPYIHASYTSDSIANLTLTKYLLLGIDDYQNNRINNGLVSIEPVESYIDIKKLDTAQLKVSNCGYSNDINYIKQYTNKVDNELQTTTTAELKTINALEQNKVQIDYKSRSPTINIFAILKIPLDNTLTWGQLITNDNIFDNQYIRKYFGPVSLNSFKVTLYTEDGYILNLNDRNWNFSIFCKQLYKY